MSKIPKKNIKIKLNKTSKTTMQLIKPNIRQLPK